MPYYSNIVLSKNILIDKQHKNVLDYGNGAMLELMRSQAHLVAQASNYSFIQNGKISVGFTYDQCLTSNYIAFQNPTYSAKWFFAFIDKIEYESNKSTLIYYTIDNWTTWFDNFKNSIKPCYVLREHTNNDAIGANTVDEGLQVQDVVCESTETDGGLGQFFYVGVLSTWNLDSKTGYNGISVINRGVFGSNLCLFEYNTQAQLIQLLYFILQTNADGHPEDIHDIFIIPSSLINASQLQQHTYNVEIGGQVIVQNAYYYTLGQQSYDATEYDWQVDKTLSFNDYQPKNNKVFCYPFNYLMVSNNCGDVNILKYEDFSNSTKATFKVQLALSIGCSGRIVPTNYKRVSENLSESVTLGKYPVCQWSSDSYTNWLTQNSINNQAQFLSLGLNAITGLGGVANSAQTAFNNDTEFNGLGAIGSVGNLALQAYNLYGQFYKAQLLPERVSGSNTADVNFASNDNTFKLTHMRIKTEYLKELDDYFTRFGYKTLRVKTPNITGRQNFNYIEIGVGERFAYGEIPPDALNEINLIAQNGVTIWHNHANVGNYNITNNIL